MPALSDELRQQILAYIQRYPSKQAVTLPALHLVQDELRCVPLDAIREIADLLDLSPAEVSDTMTFYGFFREEDRPQGRTRLWVCRSLACMLRGSEELLQRFSDKLGRTRLWVCRGLACAIRGGEEVLASVCQKLNVRPGGTSADGQITVEFAECIGVCEGAPAVMVNDSGRGNVTGERVDALLEELRRS